MVEKAPHSFLVPDPGGGSRYAEGVFARMEEWLAERGFTDDSCWGDAGP